MRKQRRFFLLLLLFLLLLAALPAIFNLQLPTATAESGETAVFDLSWDVVASGGATMSSDSFLLLSTTGQPAVGEVSSSSYSFLSGYWAGIVVEIKNVVEKILLPVVLQEVASE